MKNLRDKYTSNKHATYFKLRSIYKPKVNLYGPYVGSDRLHTIIQRCFAVLGSNLFINDSKYGRKWKE